MVALAKSIRDFNNNNKNIVYVVVSNGHVIESLWTQDVNGFYEYLKITGYNTRINVKSDQNLILTRKFHSKKKPVRQQQEVCKNLMLKMFCYIHEIIY